MRVLSVRARAALLLSMLTKQNGSLSTLLGRNSETSPQDQALLQEICFGTCRWYFQLDALLSQLLVKPMKSKDSDIRCLLLIGLYQLHYLRVPDYAVVNESVAACKEFGKDWAKGLINAVLRGFIRDSAALFETIENDIAAQTAHPMWLVGKLRKAWPDAYLDILAANNERPPMTLRVNARTNTRQEYLTALDANGITARAGLLADSCIYLEKPTAVDNLPDFHEGSVSVQDEASQLIPSLLELEPGLRVLDACAAPGGKTCHMLESERSLSSVLALDLDDRRLDRLRENLGRLKLDAEIIAADAGELSSWWNGEPFDRILLDAPCSATGIIRRHPDIKILRQPDDVKKLVELQLDLLKRLWETLKPGGLLLYSTCSVLPEENSKIVQQFVQQFADAKHEEIHAQWGVECAYGRQLHPSVDGNDGFYFARLRKLPKV